MEFQISNLVTPIRWIRFLKLKWNYTWIYRVFDRIRVLKDICYLWEWLWSTERLKYREFDHGIIHLGGIFQLDKKFPREKNSRKEKNWEQRIESVETLFKHITHESSKKIKLWTSSDHRNPSRFRSQIEIIILPKTWWKIEKVIPAVPTQQDQGKFLKLIVNKSGNSGFPSNSFSWKTEPKIINKTKISHEKSKKGTFVNEVI